MTVAALDTLAEAEAALAADFKAGTITETALAEGLAAAYNAAFGGASTPLEAALLAQQAISRLTAFVDDFLGNVGLRILGVLTSTSQLPATGNGIGDAFLISANLWVWTGSVWANAGPITGPAGQITSVTVAAGAPGTGASIVVGGTPSARTLALTIATGQTGPSGTITSATATTGLPGTDVQLTLGGSASARTFAFVIPRGDTGQTGPAPNTSASVTMIATGGTATVTRSGPDTAPHFTFNIPRPADGDDGRQIELNASATHFQYRYAGDAAWTDLIALDTFTGATGAKGDGLEIAARGANLAARAAYDAEAADFTFLDLETGLLYWRETATPGVWSDPVTFGTELNDVLEALADLSSSAGVLVQTGPATFAKRAIGTATGAAIPDRDAADARYRKLSDQTPLADVAGLAAVLEEKADAGAVLAMFGGKQDKDATLTALAALTLASNKLIYATGADEFATTDLTAVARTLLAQTTQALMRTAGLGFSANGSALVSATDYAAMRGLLSISIATAAQIRAGTNDAAFTTAKGIIDSVSWVAVAASGVFNLDLTSGINFDITLNANSTFGVPTNMTPGMSGFIIYRQPAVGGKTLARNTAVRVKGGSMFTVSTGNNAIDIGSYLVLPDGSMSLSDIDKGVA